MTNPYIAITNYNGMDWEGFLRSLSVENVFHPLREVFEGELLGKVVKYIVWTYSVDSDRIIVGMEWQFNKQKIFDLVGLPGDAWHAIGLMENAIIIDVINKWLDVQNNEVFSEWCMLKELRREMQESAVSKIETAAGQVDYDQKMKNATYVTRLRSMINDLEANLIQNSPTLKEGVREARGRRKQPTAGPENYSY